MGQVSPPCQLLHFALAVNWAQRLLFSTEILRELPTSLDITLLARHAHRLHIVICCLAARYTLSKLTIGSFLVTSNLEHQDHHPAWRNL
ncbi:hypothetical protein SVAN01_08612 [Stagonosporopsis vannaccii]|nr:hypothetical protein SVAN01_08612 [Stagonosporopsis vannaccii]